MPVADSEAYFVNYLKETKLYSPTRWTNLKSKGWTTMESYAFAWGHIEQGKVPTETVFEQIIEVIEGFKWGDQSTYPRMQQGGRPLGYGHT